MFLVFIICFAALTSATKPNVDQLLSKVEKLLNAQKEMAAIPILRQILSDPDSLSMDDFVFASNSLGTALAQNGQVNEAISIFMQSFQKQQQQIFNSKSISKSTSDQITQTCFNLGFTYQKLGDTNSSLRYYELAIQYDPKFFPAYVKAAFHYNQQQNYSQAIAYLRTAIKLNPKDPKTYRYLGDTLNNLKRWSEAVEVYKQAIKLDPKNYEYHLYLADTYSNMKQYQSALNHYQSSVKLSKKHPKSMVGLLNIKQELCDWGSYSSESVGIPNNVEDTNKRFSTLELHHNYNLWSELIHDVKEWATQFVHNKNSEQREHEDPSESPLSPYQSLFLPLSPQLQKSIAESWAKQYIQQSRSVHSWIQPLYVPHIDVLTSKQSNIINIGYVSRRIECYAGTQLMLRIFGLHDRNKFKIFVFANGPDDMSKERQIIKETCDEFHDISNNTPLQSALFIASLHIHILVDYDGLHDFNNMNILALQPSPIQISFLGFAGTTGAYPVIQYLVTDPYIVPPSSPSSTSRVTIEQNENYSERLLYMPHSYQPQDHIPDISSYVFTREELGLPQNAFVYVCFNRLNKLEPGIFTAWMTILQRVPNSILWLYDGSSTNDAFDSGIQIAKRNLIGYAEVNHGVSSDRIIFGGRLSKPLHLARHKVADLFLDTHYYNAHTTASDSLWAGIPVLTFSGSSFASRVAGSLLKAANLEELIMPSSDAYIDKAVEIGNEGPYGSSIRKLKSQLEHNRQNTIAPFFNTPVYVKNLEDGYMEVWNNFLNHPPK